MGAKASVSEELVQKLCYMINDNNYILMYVTCNEGKSIVVLRLERALKSKIYEKMTAN